MYHKVIDEEGQSLLNRKPDTSLEKFIITKFSSLVDGRKHI